MKKKRILLVSDVKGWGGWVRAEYIKKHLSDEFDFEIIDSKEFNEYTYITDKNLFTQEDLHQFKNKKSEDKEFFKLDKFSDFVKNKKKKDRFDLYYLLFHTMLARKNVRRLINYKKNIVSIVTGRNVEKSIFQGNFKRFLKGSKAIFANNMLAFNDLNKMVDIPTFYLPRGVDEKVFYPEENENEKFTVVYVGKPVHQKGLERYIKPACKQLKVDLLINDRNYTNALGEDEMRKFYNKADAYIVASISDGTPNPALEAAACGKPIISNKIGNMPEFIEHGRNGFLLKERDIDLYVHFLQRLVDNREKCKEMGNAARETILKGWTWKKVLENERKAFRKILGGNNDG